LNISTLNIEELLTHARHRFHHENIVLRQNSEKSREHSGQLRDIGRMPYRYLRERGDRDAP
jgi:hypothetical protein